MYLNVPCGVQTEIIKSSLLGLSLVIVDLMRRLISTIDSRSIFSYIAFFAGTKCISYNLLDMILDLFFRTMGWLKFIN